MSLRNTFALIVILLGLGAYLYFVEVPREEQRQIEDRLVDLAVEDIDGVRLERDDDVVALTRDDDDVWWLVEPVAAKADAAAVRSLLSAIIDGKIERSIDDAGAPDAFGLGADAIGVALSRRDGEDIAFRVGKATPVGNSVYLQREGDAAVLLISAGFRNMVDKQPDELRDKRVFDFEDGEVAWIEIASPTRKARLERTEDGWRLPGETIHDGDATAIRTYLASLRSLRVASFVDESPEDLSAFGLDNPRLTVRFGLDGEREFSVAIGTDKAGSEFHAVATPGGNVFTVHDWVYRNLDKSARDLRDKSLLAIAGDDVRAVSVLRRDGDAYRILRSENAWELIGVDGEADGDALAEYIADVIDLAGYEIVTDDPDQLSPYGLDAPILQITVQGEGDAPLGSVVVGKTIAADNTHHFHAQSDKSPMVVRIRAYIFNRLDRDPATLLARPADDDGDDHSGHAH